MKRLFAALALAALMAAGATAEITIEAPDDPVAVGDPVQLYVDGLTDADLPKAVVDHHPQEKTIVIPAKTWGGRPFLWFQAKEPGVYALWVAAPGDEAVQYAKALITVGDGDDDEEDDDPDPPVPPVPGERWILIISETNRPDFRHRNLLAELRTSDRLDQGHLWIVDPQTAQPELAPYVDLAGDLPALLIVGEDEDGQGVILHKGPCPESLEAVVDLLEEHGG